MSDDRYQRKFGPVDWPPTVLEAVYNNKADAMSDEELPPLHKVIAACKIGHKYLGPDTVDLAAAAWLERQQTEIERLREENRKLRYEVSRSSYHD